MSFRVQNIVLSSKIPATPRLVLHALAWWANHDGSNVFPKVEDVAARAGLSVRQTQRVMAELRRRGFLVLLRESNGRPGEANRYRIDLDVVIGAKVSERVSDCHPLEPCDGCQDVTPTGDKTGMDGCQDVTPRVTLLSPLIDNPSLNSSEPVTTRAREASLPVQKSLMLPIACEPAVCELDGFATKIWPAIIGWPNLSAQISEKRTRAAWERRHVDLPDDDTLAACARLHGRKLGAEAAKRRNPADMPVVWPHNWLDRDEGWKAYLLEVQRDGAAPGPQICALSDDHRARLARCGFSPAIIATWFGDAAIDDGPPTVFWLKRPFAARWVENNYGGALRREWGNDLQIATGDQKSTRAA
jgi:hypothetical protein